MTTEQDVINEIENRIRTSYYAFLNICGFVYSIGDSQVLMPWEYLNPSRMTARKYIMSAGIDVYGWDFCNLHGQNMATGLVAFSRREEI